MHPSYLASYNPLVAVLPALLLVVVRSAMDDGDGTGGEATIVVDNQSKVDSVTISNGGSGYTYGRIDLTTGNFPQNVTRK